MEDSIKFKFDRSYSEIFGYVYRPIAEVNFWSKKINKWIKIIMIVDSGADYTLLPRFYANDLGIKLKKDCHLHETGGIGGREKVYLYKKMRVKLGKWEKVVPVGFLNRDNIPPLLGRHKFLEVFKVIINHHWTIFSPKESIRTKK